MLDIKYIRDNTDKIKEAIKNKNIKLDLDELLQVDEDRRKAMSEIDALRAKRNQLAERVQGGKPTSEQIEEGKKLKELIAENEEQFKKIESIYANLMVKVPTIPSADTPIGRDDSGNIEVSRWGEPTKFDFEPKTYIELAENLDLIDFKRGVKVAGYRGYYLKNEAVMIQIGLMMLAMETLIKKGFTPMIPPTLIREFALFGTGYFSGKEYDPDKDEIYKIANDEILSDGTRTKESKFLVGTAEPSLLSYYADEVLKEADLPIKLCGFSPCYRSEIGSYGKDAKGIYRVHEFMKVEQVAIIKADIEEADKIHEEMVSISEELHQILGLPYRKLKICTGDMSTGKYKMYDLEAWMPSREGYGETGSASNFLDWQSRRINVKYEDDNGQRHFVYMANNTALASPRILISIFENYQQADGSILIPDALKKYCQGKESISRR